jgi:hypothetical protein
LQSGCRVQRNAGAVGIEPLPQNNQQQRLETMTTTSSPLTVLRHISLAPALLIAAQHANPSISELVMTYRLNGLGGDRACRKLIHRLHRLNLLQVDRGGRDDRREKSVRLTDEARGLLRDLRDHLHSLSL